MQQIWRRIWDGYVAFGTLGSLSQDINDHFAQAPSLTDQMVAMIQRKAQYARQNHGVKKMGTNFINDWFDDPNGMLDEMVSAGFVVPGKPDESKIFQLMSFTGPMFHVFTEQEQTLWRDYILSLVPQPPAPQFDIEAAMRYVVRVLRQRQTGTTGHKPLLIGVDPNTAQEVTQSIAWWFDHDFGTPEQNDDALLSALRNPKNGWILPGDATSSPLVTQLLAGNGAMAQAFRGFLPGEIQRGGPVNAQPAAAYTFKQVMAIWIDAGCPIQHALDPSFLAQSAKLHATTKARAASLATSHATSHATSYATSQATSQATSLPEAAERQATVAKSKRRRYGNGRPH